jgi:hypothetical protein
VHSREEFMKNFLTSALVGGVGLATSTVLTTLATPAQAFDVNLSPTIGSTENTGASASLDFNFSQSGVDTFLELGIRNTTDGSLGLGATQATLVGVGFELPTPAPSFTYDPLLSTFTQTYFNQNATLQPYGTFDIGIRSNSNGNGTFAGGNPQQGLTAGQSTTVRFTFANQNAANLATSFQTLFANSTNANPLIVGRFQQVNAGGGSDKVVGGLTPEAVPSPPIVLGMLTAGAFGSAMKWRQKRQLRQ